MGYWSVFLDKKKMNRIVKKKNACLTAVHFLEIKRKQDRITKKKQAMQAMQSMQAKQAMQATQAQQAEQNDLHFQVQLCRLYPHIYNVMRRLVQEFDNARKNIEPVKETGTFATTAVFGRLCHGAQSQFDSNIAIPEMNTIFTLLSSFDAWDSVSDWFLTYDYHITKDTNVRVSYENKRQAIQATTRQKLAAVDCSYRQANPTLKLGDCLTRICMSFDQEATTIEEVAAFQSVTISMRKYFLIRSSNLQSVSFRFELVQYWEGSTPEEVERKLKTISPLCFFQCEVLHTPTLLTESEKSLLFVSLLLKMQDFIDVPMYTRLLQCNDKVSTIIPTFEIV